MDTFLPIYEILFRLALAAACGMAIGWERESLRKEAGLRTHMLVCVGAAGFMIAIIELAAGKLGGDTGVSIDPSRAYQGLIGGIGFLGAGAIIQSRGNVHGITTAAGIWVCGAVGLASGQGSYLVAVMLAGLTVIILLFCRAFAKPVVHAVTEDQGDDEDPLFGEEVESGELERRSKAVEGDRKEGHNGDGSRKKDAS